MLIHLNIYTYTVYLNLYRVCLRTISGFHLNNELTPFFKIFLWLLSYAHSKTAETSKKIKSFLTIQIKSRKNASF